MCVLRGGAAVGMHATDGFDDVCCGGCVAGVCKTLAGRSIGMQVQNARTGPAAVQWLSSSAGCCGECCPGWLSLLGCARRVAWSHSESRLRMLYAILQQASVSMRCWPCKQWGCPAVSCSSATELISMHPAKLLGSPLCHTTDCLHTLHVAHSPLGRPNVMAGLLFTAPKSPRAAGVIAMQARQCVVQSSALHL